MNLAELNRIEPQNHKKKSHGIYDYPNLSLELLNCYNYYFEPNILKILTKNHMITNSLHNRMASIAHIVIIIVPFGQTLWKIPMQCLIPQNANYDCTDPMIYSYKDETEFDKSNPHIYQWLNVTKI